MKKKTILRFIATYICVLLPVLFATVFVTQDFIENAAQKETNELKNQAAACAQLLQDYYNGIPVKGISLFQNSAFFSQNILTNPVVCLEAMCILQNIQHYAGEDESICVYYGEGPFVTESGTVSPVVYFGNTLGCFQSDVEVALTAIKKSERNTVFLNNQGGGYLLFHMPIGKDGYGYMRSVEIVTSVSGLSKMLGSALRSENIILQLQVQNEEIYFYNTDSGCTYITDRQAQSLLDGFRQTQQFELDAGSMQLQIQYDPLEQMAEFYQLRNINIVLLCVSLLVSVSISLALSFVRFSGLENLANHIRRKEPAKKRWIGAEIDYIQTLFHGYISENKSSRQQIIQYQRILLKQVSAMMMHGYLRDEDEIRSALRACRAELNEEYFFVIGIELENQDSLDRLDDLLQSDIHSITVQDEKRLMFVLCELPHSDETQTERLAIANRLLSTLESVGISCAYLTISQVYSVFSQVNLAYLESHNMITNISDPELKVITWEKFIEITENDRVKIGTTYISEFQFAIATGDARAVVEVLSGICSQGEFGDDMDGSRDLRCACIQMLIAEICAQDDIEENDGIAEELSAVETAEQEKFEITVFKILQKYFTERDHAAAFDRVLQFVETNYTAYDFSLEMVAAFAGCSKSQVSKLFRLRTGVSYLEYVTHLRMAKAREMLEQTDMNVKDIFNAVGYMDTTNASKKFRVCFGVNPSVYRTQHQQTKQE